jgi:hypothetical protein
MARRGAEERDLDGWLPARGRRLRIVPLRALVAHEHQPITWPMQRRQPKQWNILRIEEPAAKGEESAVAPQICLVRGWAKAVVRRKCIRAVSPDERARVAVVVVDPSQAVRRENVGV